MSLRTPVYNQINEIWRLFAETFHARKSPGKLTVTCSLASSNCVEVKKVHPKPSIMTIGRVP